MRFKGISLFSAGIVFAIVFASMRGMAMLFPLKFGYLLPLGFVAMVILPFVFLRKAERRTMGFSGSSNFKFYVIAIVAGAVMALSCYCVGVVLFGHSNDNWFMTIKHFYESNPSYQSQMPRMQLFMIFTIPAMIFSPFGEEIFFRGFLNLSMRERFNPTRSMIIDSIIFGSVHLFHHGMIIADGTLKFYALSGIIWMVLMFTVAMAFAWLKEKSGSLYPAILSHSVFNLVMNTTIFYLL